MRVKLLMMFKNEDELLEPWIRYHADLFGPDNLIVFDNGTSSDRCLHTIKWARDEFGVKIDQHFATHADFVNKGEIFSRNIKSDDQHDPFDFYIPIDCDEFVAVADGDDIQMTRQAIFTELGNYTDGLAPLSILAGLDNSPVYSGKFKWSHNQRKTFFVKGTCKFLDHGFHNGQTKSGLPPQKTNIVFVHFHYKPYDLLVQHARAKLEPYTSDFSQVGLERYVSDKRSNHHCAKYLLTSEAAYAQMFNEKDYQSYPEIEDALSKVEAKLPF